MAEPVKASHPQSNAQERSTKPQQPTMSGFVLNGKSDSLDAHQQPTSFNHDLQSARQSHPGKQSSLPDEPEVPSDPSQSSDFTECLIDEGRCSREIQPPSPFAGQHPSTSQQGDAPSWPSLGEELEELHDSMLVSIALEMESEIAHLQKKIQTLKQESARLRESLRRDRLGGDFTG